MSQIIFYVTKGGLWTALIAVLFGPNRLPAEAVRLREELPPGTVTRVRVELKAEGFSRPGLPPNLAGAREGKPLALRVETRFSFDERVLEGVKKDKGPRVARRVTEAAAAINGQVRPTAAALRPELALLVSEVRDGAVFTYSPGGPLTRSELELVEATADPLTLASLLPEREVKLGKSWNLGSLAARALSNYDALAANSLEATLEALDESSAQCKLRGEVRGAVLGGEGTVACEGSFRFDRKAGLVDHVSLVRTEKRMAGPVEAGLDLKSTLVVDRRRIEPPPELTEGALAALPAAPAQGLELLQYVSPDGKFTLLHDRNWYLFADDVRHTVWKRLDHGELVAQCNVASGPNAGKGRHQDLDQFRDDVKRALGRRFDRVLEAGEVEGPAEGGFRYRVAVAGREGDVGVLWYYYLIASPDGDQLLVAFTLGGAQAKQFADQDLRMIGSLQWLHPPEKAAEPGNKP